MAAAKKLVYYVTVADETGNLHTFGPDSDVPAWAVKAITNPKVWADSDDEGDEEPQVGKYDGLKKAELEDLVAKRNEGRSDDGLLEVGGTGTKADLIAALVADDEAGE